MAQDMVSAGEAARRLGVAPATIQRWVDGGVLRAERTPGGHRRIHVAELRRLIAASIPEVTAGPVAAWWDVLMTGDAAKVKAALISSRQDTGSWASTADEVASAMVEIGRQWEAGRCQIFEEHTATEALRRAAAACAEEIRYANGAPCAALFTVEKERHTLGLALAELVVLEAGWRPLWIGEGPPAEELGTLVSKLKPDALVVAASAATLPTAVAMYQAALSAQAAKTGTKLILAGGGAWKETAPAERVLAFKDLAEALS